MGHCTVLSCMVTVGQTLCQHIKYSWVTVSTKDIKEITQIPISINEH